MNSILNGMRVVEGSAFVAVPLAGMTLAQMGAEVIRFDRIGGGLDVKRWPVAQNGLSHFWAGMNKGKKSVAVDMKTPEGKELITRIITAPGDDAGLFLTNLKVQGWMDYPTLSKFREDLIMVALKGDRFGRPQVDYTVNPALGFPDITGAEGSEDPVGHALPAWDCIAGNMMVSAVLAAERHRLRTGKGQDVEFSLKDVGAAMLGHLGIIGDVATGGEKRTKSGNSLYGAYGQDFVCKDGQRVMVIGLTDRQWRGLVKMTGVETDIAYLSSRLGADLNDEGERFRHRAKITKILTPYFATRNISDFADDFDNAGLTWSLFRDFETALAEDADLSTANPMFSDIETPGMGTFPVPGSPLNFSASERQEPVAAPPLGMHTEEVLCDVVGVSDRELGQLFDKGIVESPHYQRARIAA